MVRLRIQHLPNWLPVTVEFCVGVKLD